MSKLWFTIVCGSLMASAIAGADPKTAEEWFKEGETQYDLGNFDKAAEAFKQAFTLEASGTKRPAYLYNVAQAYRQGGRCKDAAFFYKRFLALKESDTAKPLSQKTKEQTEQLVAQMEECAKQQEANAGRPPTTTMHPEDGSKTTGTTGSGTTTGTGAVTTGAGTGTASAGGTKTATKTVASRETDGGSVTGGVTATPGIEPKLVNARFVLGAAKLSAGGLDVPIESTFGVIGGYPIPLKAPVRLDVGLALMVNPVGYTNSITMEKATASFTSVMANGGATYTVAPKIAVRGDLGLGLMVLSGIDQPGNPFTQSGQGTSGALVMPAVRVSASAEYEITPNIVGIATPFALTAAPAKSGLRGGFARFDFMVGVGYRM
jgi:hypothetical protein